MKKILIKKSGVIPFVGRRGPILRPIKVCDTVYENLKKLGYPVELVEDCSPKNTVTYIKREEPVVVIKNSSQKVDEPVEKEETVVVEEVPVEVVDNDQVPEVVENTVIEEVPVIEIIENDPDISATSYYTMDFLTNKAVCRKILDARSVTYDEDASFSMLKKLVMQSNPEVDLGESTEEVSE